MRNSEWRMRNVGEVSNRDSYACKLPAFCDSSSLFPPSSFYHE